LCRKDGRQENMAEFNLSLEYSYRKKSQLGSQKATSDAGYWKQ